jgi:amino acid transporter
MSLKRDLGPGSLLFSGIGAIIGSGWLFGAQRAAALAGPGATLAWILGAVLILTIAAVAAELGTMFPVSGGTVRYAQVTHGPLVGFIAAWANWISIVTAIPIEAESSIQYMSSWSYPWAQALLVNEQLTQPGLLLASALLIIYFLLNFWGVKLFARSNNLITVFKIAVPTITAVGLLLTAHHVSNLTGGDGGFLPYGGASLLTAVATSGIVLSFNGFQSPLSLAGEARRPEKSLPFAMLGAVLITAVVYVLLQIAFIGAVSPAVVARGWNTLSFTSPFAQLAIALNLNWLAVTLYVDAFVSPSGAGITDMATTSRMVYGMERNGLAPAILGRIDARYGVPRPALWFNLVVSFFFLYFFRGWGALAAVISVAAIISYFMIPISALALRRTAPHLDRPWRMPAMGILGRFAFVASVEMLYWAGWPLTGEVILVFVGAIPIYIWYRRSVALTDLLPELKAAAWLVLFLPTIAFVSWCGSRAFGGQGWLSYGWDMVVIAALALGFCEWGLRSAYANPATGSLETPEEAFKYATEVADELVLSDGSR